MCSTSSSRMHVINHNWSATKQHLSSAECSRDKPPFSFVRGQDSTMWDIVWVSPQGHRSVSVSRHFLLQALWKWFSSDYCCRGRSKPGCQIVGSHIRWELTTWADFQLCLHRLLMSTGCKSSHIANSFQSRWFRAISSASVSVRLWGFMSFCTVLHHVIRGHPDCHFQPSGWSTDIIVHSCYMPEAERDAWIRRLRWEVTDWSSTELLHWKPTDTTWYLTASAGTNDQGRRFSMHTPWWLPKIPSHTGRSVKCWDHWGINRSAWPYDFYHVLRQWSRLWLKNDMISEPLAIKFYDGNCKGFPTVLVTKLQAEKHKWPQSILCQLSLWQGI